MLPDVPTLRDKAAGADHYLGARNLIGRANVCTLRIVRPSVSGLHSQLLWNGSGWYAQDLNSRNGTFVDGRRLDPGEQAPLDVGTTLGFGAPEPAYQLVDASAPRLMATSDEGSVLVADADLLCLPSPEACEVSVFCNGYMRWVVESDDGERVLEDQDLLVAAGRAWRVSLPSPPSATRQAGENAHPAIYDLTLAFHLSRDGEHVTATLTQGNSTVELEYRAHLFLLLELARARLEDATRSNLPPNERGWVYRDELLKKLHIDASLLNIWIYRARQQLAKANVRGAGSVLERRPGTHQLRIGVDKLCLA